MEHLRRWLLVHHWRPSADDGSPGCGVKGAVVMIGFGGGQPAAPPSTLARDPRGIYGRSRPRSGGGGSICQACLQEKQISSRTFWTPSVRPRRISLPDPQEGQLSAEVRYRMAFGIDPLAGSLKARATLAVPVPAAGPETSGRPRLLLRPRAVDA